MPNWFITSLSYPCNFCFS